MTLFAAALAVAGVAWVIGYDLGVARGRFEAARAWAALLAAERASTRRCWESFGQATRPLSIRDRVRGERGAARWN